MAPFGQNRKLFYHPTNTAKELKDDSVPDWDSMIPQCYHDSQEHSNGCTDCLALVSVFKEAFQL